MLRVWSVSYLMRVFRSDTHTPDTTPVTTECVTVSTHTTHTRVRPAECVGVRGNRSGSLSPAPPPRAQREHERESHVVVVASYAACSILRVLTQWGATLVINNERESQRVREREWVATLIII